MTVNLVRSGSLYTGVPYAYASVAPRGSLIFTAGACPLDDRGEVVGAGDVRAQASLAVANLATALAESGATLADVLKTTVFVASAERADLVAGLGCHQRGLRGARRAQHPARRDRARLPGPAGRDRGRRGRPGVTADHRAADHRAKKQPSQ